MLATHVFQPALSNQKGLHSCTSKQISKTMTPSVTSVTSWWYANVRESCHDDAPMRNVRCIVCHDMQYKNTTNIPSDWLSQTLINHWIHLCIVMSVQCFQSIKLKIYHGAACTLHKRTVWILFFRHIAESNRTVLTTVVSRTLLGFCWYFPRKLCRW